jgi:uncharacterized protein YdcH (DUF465 family)
MNLRDGLRHPQKEVDMSSQQDLRLQLADHDPEFRRLLDEHRERERRLAELKLKGWLTADEEQEEKRLKKEKLRLKDQMESIVRRHTA